MRTPQVTMLPSDDEPVVLRLPDPPEEMAARAVIHLPDFDEQPTATRTKRIRLPDLANREERAVGEVVAEGQRLLFKHPAAAQAAYRALVTEGRRFAETDEGRAWRARLATSPNLRRFRPLWEAATFNVLDARGDAHLPPRLIELVAQALSHADMEATTAFLTENALGAREGQ